MFNNSAFVLCLWSCLGLKGENGSLCVYACVFERSKHSVTHLSNTFLRD